jgi:hypothetical protein
LFAYIIDKRKKNKIIFFYKSKKINLKFKNLIYIIKFLDKLYELWFIIEQEKIRQKNYLILKIK